MRTQDGGRRSWSWMELGEELGVRERPERWGSEGGGPRGYSRSVGWARGLLLDKKEV